jgi:hypothetical protein
MSERIKITAIGVSVCVALAACSPAWAGQPDDLPRLRDAICRKESRHLSVPAHAQGDSGLARGECQVWVSTAREITPWAVARGHVPPYMLIVAEHEAALTAMLHESAISRGYALAILDRLAVRKGIRDPRKLAYWYNAGPRARYGANAAAMRYAAEVWIMLQGPPPMPRRKETRIP